MSTVPRVRTPAPARPQKAAALDPHDVAAQPGPEGEAAAARRDEVCYQPAMAVLRLLIDRTGVGAVGAGYGWRASTVP